MFELYSERARQVIFLARLESGARGAEMIDVDDLLAALIVEDQNKTPEFLEMLGTQVGGVRFGRDQAVRGGAMVEDVASCP
jgi:hypothetical protein